MRMKRWTEKQNIKRGLFFHRQDVIWTLGDIRVQLERKMAHRSFNRFLAAARKDVGLANEITYELYRRLG